MRKSVRFICAAFIFALILCRAALPHINFPPTASPSQTAQQSSPPVFAAGEDRPVLCLSLPSPSPSPSPSGTPYSLNSVSTTVTHGTDSRYICHDGVWIKNNSSYSPDIAALLCSPLELSASSGGPRVLIIHTHSTEAYEPEGEDVYEKWGSDWRTTDTDFSVVRVGAELAEGLRAQGIEVIHHTALNDYPAYSGSYTRILPTIEQYLKKYPSIEVVIDLHRDYLEASDGRPLRTVVTLPDGRQAAQVMLYMGTDGGGLSHPNWKQNLSLAVKLQYELNAGCKNFARSITLVDGRYNQHVSTGSLILEVGTAANTLQEALLSAQYTAAALGRLLVG